MPALLWQSGGGEDAMPIELCVFDAYGTLFDVDAAARAVAAEPGQAGFAAKWPALSADWRAKQLQYSWIRAVTGAHADFRTVTTEALDWALDAAGLSGDAALRDRLLALYRNLRVYAEVPATLSALRAAGLGTAILSNGTPDMLDAAIAAAGIGGAFDAVLSVERVGVFKPDARVYHLVGAHFGTRPDAVLFVSANGWDAAAAAGYGFATAWVNRAGAPVDRLPWRPDHVIDSLAGVPALAVRA
jgi:2-haloacid dehalogenase